MKKLALALMAISATIFGISAVANAYPPAPNAAVVSDSTPGAGEEFSSTVGCTPPGDVLFSAAFPTPVSINSSCVASATGAPAALLSAAPAAGSATATFTAPTEPGTYTISYTGAATGSFTITVAGPATPVTPGGGLPATGSNGTGTMTILAIGLFAVGAGLFGVSQMRRRTTAA